jgi:hypothetical protein
MEQAHDPQTDQCQSRTSSRNNAIKPTQNKIKKVRWARA